MSSGYAWSEKSVLVTGATGLLGQHLCSDLNARGVRVGILRREPGPAGGVDHNAAELALHGDIRSRESVCAALAEHRPSILFHLAASSQVGHDDVYDTFSTNSFGTLNVLDAVREVSPNCTVVVLSTAALGLVGAEASGSSYLASKDCCERLAQHYCVSLGVNTITVRLANVYGPGDSNRNRLVPTLLRAAATDPAIMLRGHPASAVNLLYVSDAVSALLALAVAEETYLGEKRSPITLCAETAVSVAEVVGALEVALGKNLEIAAESYTRPRHSAATTLVPDERLKQIGWRQQVGLVEGLQRTIAHGIDSRHHRTLSGDS